MAASRHTQCTVCVSTISSPRTLPCLHSFCQGCLVPLVGPQDRSLACPTCKQECQLGKDGVGSLPVNPLLVDALNRICQKCRVRDKDVHCDVCEEETCKICYDICKIQSEVRGEIQKDSEQLEALRQERERRVAHKERLVKDMHGRVQNTINTLLYAQNRIINQYETEAQAQIAPLQALSREIERETSEIASFQSGLDERLKNATPATLQELKDEADKLNAPDTAINRPIPPDTAQYTPDASLMQEIVGAVDKLAVELQQTASTQ